MTLPILTVAYQNAEQLEALIGSVQKYLRTPATLWIWDNGGNGPAMQSRELPPFLQVRTFGQGKNIGFAAAVNRGLETIRQDFSGENFPFIVINPDAEFASEITPELIQNLSAQKALIGLRVFNDRDKKLRQASARTFPSFGAAFGGREGWLTKYFPKNPFSRRYLRSDLDPDVTNTVDWVSGCAFFCTSEIWAKLGAYDESYFLYVEDVDLGRKAQAKKIPVLYSPQIDVVHLIRGSAEKRFWKADYYHHLGMWIYFVKWSKAPTFICGPLVFLGIWLRFLLRRIVGP